MSHRPLLKRVGAGSGESFRNAPVAQPDRVAASEAVGRGFESLQARQSDSDNRAQRTRRPLHSAGVSRFGLGLRPRAASPSLAKISPLLPLSSPSPWTSCVSSASDDFRFLCKSTPYAWSREGGFMASLPAKRNHGVLCNGALALHCNRNRA